MVLFVKVLFNLFINRIVGEIDLVVLSVLCKLVFDFFIIELLYICFIFNCNKGRFYRWDVVFVIRDLLYLGIFRINIFFGWGSLYFWVCFVNVFECCFN